MNKKKEVIFYAIAGKNGFGVFTDKEKLKKAKEFMHKPTVVKSDSKFKAFKEAIEIYNSVQDDFDAAYFGEISELKLDWVVFRREVLKKNKEEVLLY